MSHKAAEYATQHFSRIKKLSRTRSAFFAPKLYPVMGCAPWHKPESGSMENCIILPRIVIAPTAVSPPYSSREELKQMFRILSVDCITKGLSPSRIQGNIVFARSRRCFFCSFSMVRFPVKNRSTHAADNAWERMVASAAPLTPISSRKIKMGSRIILVTAPMSVVFMLIFANPWAVIKAFSPRLICTKTVPNI